MNKCLRITLIADFPVDFLHKFIHKNAKKLNIEGTAQAIAADKIRIIACGLKESVDDFLDLLHKGSASWVPDVIEVEPFLKDKDYRGVFRIIE